jgi:hypothetical protein
MSNDIQICPPREYDNCPCGDAHIYYCGRMLLQRDPTDQNQACPGGTMICIDCVSDFENFIDAAYDARARRKEWEL